MFSSLKDIIDLVREGVLEYKKFKSNRDRKKIVIQLLEFYFLLKDCVEEGEIVCEESKGDPVRTIRAMDGESAVFTLTKWDTILRRQGTRLRLLQGHVAGDHYLSVINPVLQGRISKVIGRKMERHLTLHGIGSALFLRTMLPLQESDDAKARLVAMMAGEDSRGKFHMSKIRKEIGDLRRSLDEYHDVVKHLVTENEMLSLSAQARKATLFRA